MEQSYFHSSLYSTCDSRKLDGVHQQESNQDTFDRNRDETEKSQLSFESKRKYFGSLPQTKDRLVFSCDVCNKELKKKKYLNYHKVSHIDIRPCSCQICGKTFKHLYAVKMYARIHEGVKDHCSVPHQKPLGHTHKKRHYKFNKFTCEFCDKGFISQFHYDEHKNLHTGNKQFKCGIWGESCGVSSSWYYYRRSHAEGLDLNNNPRETYGKHFTNKRTLTIHVRTHSDKRDPGNPCADSLGQEGPWKSMCGLTRTRGTLAIHVQTHSDKRDPGNPCADSLGQEGPWQSMCGLTRTRGTLAIHVRTHSDKRDSGNPCADSLGQEGPWQSMCRLTRTRGTLAIHVRTHSDKRDPGNPCADSLGQEDFCVSSAGKLCQEQSL
uniref:C2H2-type domain-containing protein n=1 Tax=Timema poppense TaxID=170557 RepID=A0A7R9GVZ4_TIMPO|nr:unnamed protein product [Timema poppensis]